MAVGVDTRTNQDLHEALAALGMAAATDGTFASAEAKAERVLLAQQVRSLAEAVVVSAVGNADGGDVASAHRCRNVADFVTQRTAVPAAVVRADAKLAKWLQEFVELDAAFRAGCISRRHVDEIRKTDNQRTSPQLRAQQTMLIELAETLGWHEFTVALRYWLIANDPDGEEPVEQQQANRVQVRKHRDGSVSGDFRLDPLRGGALLQAFESEIERRRNAEAEEDTDGSIAGQDRRQKYRERAVDAFCALFARGYARPDGSIPAPLVNIVMGVEVAEALLNDTSVAVDANDVNRRCELIDGTPLHPLHAAAALAVAQFRRHLFDAPTRIIETSRSRLFPKELRHLFHLQSRGRCSVSGCDAPFSWLQADHINPHSRGGVTSQANGQNLCGPHNRHKNARVWTATAPALFAPRGRS